MSLKVPNSEVLWTKSKNFKFDVNQKFLKLKNYIGTMKNIQKTKENSKSFLIPENVPVFCT